MENRYRTLQTLAAIVAETAHPTQYQCTIREMILRSVFDWNLIHSHLKLLADEGLVNISQGDLLQFSITQAGIDRSDNFFSGPDNTLRFIYSEIASA
ncbi:hypothetical protein [Sediminibacterium soli]|uniref:hypothetical protein n=1 Tax=Sediminibacterium soli TaxID=2698829 RepID=UPI00137B76AB|nr:hypothetical protein [Sediminibacterium soli]NCI47192.1 hypothetical protein [Sediminibacterium soli]